MRVFGCGCIPAAQEYCKEAADMRMLEYAAYRLFASPDTRIVGSIRRCIAAHYVEQSLSGAYREMP